MSSSVLSVSSSKSHDLADLGTRESLESILSFKQFIGQDQSISEWDKALFGSAKNDGSKEMIEIAQWDGSAQCTAIHSAPKSLPKSAQVDTILSSTGVLSIDRPFTSSSDTRITSYRPKASPVRHQLKSAQLSEANVKPKELTFFNSETVHKIPPVMYTEEPGPSEVRIQETLRASTYRMLQDDFSLSPTDVSSRTHIVKQLQFLEAEPTPNAAPHAQVMRSLVCSVVQDKVNHSLSILSKERCLGNADRSTLKSCSSSRVSRLTTSNFRDSHSSRLRALGINSSTLVKKFNTSVVDVNDQIELLKTTGETAVHALPSLKVADKRSLVWTCNYIQDQREIDFCRQNSVLEEKVNYKLQKRMGPEPKTPPMIIRHCRGAHSAPRAKVKAINLEIEEIERCTITRISTARSPKREIVSGNNNNKLGFQPLTDTSKSLKKETPEKACNPARAVCNNDKLGFQPLTDTSKPLKKKTPKLAYNPATAVWMLERHHLEINADKKLPATQNTDIALVSFSNEIKSPDVEDRKKIQLSKIDIAKAAECLTGQYIGSLIVLDSYGWENTDTIDGASQCVKDAGQNLPKIKTSSRLSQRSNHVRINSDDCSTSILTALKSAEDGKHACMKACGEGVFKPKCTSIEVEEVLHDIESPTSMMLQPHYEEFSAPFLLRKPLSFRTVVSMIQFFVELTRRITKLQSHVRRRIAQDHVRKIKELDVNAGITGNGDLQSPDLDPIRSRVFAPDRITAKTQCQMPPMRSKEWVRLLKMHSYLKLQYSDQFEELNNMRSSKQLQFKDLTSFKDICSHCE